MSLATRCPACGTTFKVVRDQLRISDGWVRCGRCSHVFDGGEHLHESLPVRVTSAPSPAESVGPERTSPVAPPTVSAQWAAPLPEHAGIAKVHAEAPSGALADVDFFSDTVLRLSAEAPSSGDDAASPLAPPPPPITDYIPPPPRSQPVALEAPSLGWPAFSHHAPATTVPVIEFPTETVVSDPPPAFLRENDSWSHLPSLHLGEVPKPRRVDEDSVEESSPPVDADDAPFQKALRRARIKSLKIARERAKAKDGATPSVVLTPSETATEPAPIDAVGVTAPRAPGPNDAAPVSRATRSASLDAATAASRRLRWRLPLRVAALIALVLLLTAQVLHQERNAILARQPSLRPIFATACEWLGCQLSALREIANIRIDGASFVRDKSGEGYEFSFTLRNLASIPLAMPAVELSLLDTQERTVVRRVLRPTDYGAPATLAPHAERATLLPVTLAGEDAAALPRVAGFRLDAFYP